MGFNKHIKHLKYIDDPLKSNMHLTLKHTVTLRK